MCLLEYLISESFEIFVEQFPYVRSLAVCSPVAAECKGDMSVDRLFGQVPSGLRCRG
jgi:hypothetical protein